MLSFCIGIFASVSTISIPVLGWGSAAPPKANPTKCGRNRKKVEHQGLVTGKNCASGGSLHQIALDMLFSKTFVDFGAKGILAMLSGFLWKNIKVGEALKVQKPISACPEFQLPPKTLLFGPPLRACSFEVPPRLVESAHDFKIVVPTRGDRLKYGRGTYVVLVAVSLAS